MFNKVLVPLDGSKLAECVLPSFLVSAELSLGKPTPLSFPA